MRDIARTHARVSELVARRGECARNDVSDKECRPQQLGVTVMLPLVARRGKLKPKRLRQLAALVGDATATATLPTSTHCLAAERGGASSGGNGDDAPASSKKPTAVCNKGKGEASKGKGGAKAASKAVPRDRERGGAGAGGNGADAGAGAGAGDGRCVPSLPPGYTLVPLSSLASGGRGANAGRAVALAIVLPLQRGGDAPHDSFLALGTVAALPPATAAAPAPAAAAATMGAAAAADVVDVVDDANDDDDGGRVATDDVRDVEREGGGGGDGDGDAVMCVALSVYSADTSKLLAERTLVTVLDPVREVSRGVMRCHDTT